MAVTLTAIKEQLRIDDNTEDSFLTSLIDVAKGYVEVATSLELDTELYGVSSEQDALLDFLLIAVVGHFYNYREAYTKDKLEEVPIGVAFAIKRLKKKTIGNEE